MPPTPNLPPYINNDRSLIRNTFCYCWYVVDINAKEIYYFKVRVLKRLLWKVLFRRNFVIRDKILMILTGKCREKLNSQQKTRIFGWQKIFSRKKAMSHFGEQPGAYYPEPPYVLYPWVISIERAKPGVKCKFTGPLKANQNTDRCNIEYLDGTLFWSVIAADRQPSYSWSHREILVRRFGGLRVRWFDPSFALRNSQSGILLYV